MTVGDETWCVDCGLVVAMDRLDRGPEWRRFGESPTGRRRVGAPLTAARHDRGLSTEIGFGPRDVGWDTRRLGRLRRAHRRARFQSKAERTLADGLGQIARLTSALELPRSVREAAARIYRNAQAADLILGRSIETLAAASVHAACRCGPVTRSIEALLEPARVDRRTLERGYRLLNRELGLEAAPVRPVELVSRLAADVGAPDAMRRRALELARLAEERGVGVGCDPWGVAAGCLYLAGQAHDAPLTQGELAEAAAVSRKTIRARYDELEADLERG